MTFESFPAQEKPKAKEEFTETLRSLRFKEQIDPAQIEENFHFSEISEAEAERINGLYEQIIVNPERFLGSGNNAVVFETNDEFVQECIKCRWEFLLVGHKSKKTERLPPVIQKLAKIQLYFEEIKRTRRALEAKGIEFETQNDSVREAVLTHLAFLLSEEKGLSRSVPDVFEVIQIETERSGEAAPGDPYSASEKVDMLRMRHINGFNVEQIILERKIVPDKIDIDVIKTKLGKVLEVLHANNLYHCDISLRNIMIDAETGEPWLIDFGAAQYTTGPREELEKKDTQQLESVMKMLEIFVKDPRKAQEDLAAKQKDY